MTNGAEYCRILKLSKNAAIAQPVERILGKDEVASSNLASSSKAKSSSERMGFLFWTIDRFEDLNATVRWTVARCGLDRIDTLIFIPHQGMKMQTNLASITKKQQIMLDKSMRPLYNTQAVENAAIAQPVERILGKDEVASSNLASSSIKKSETIWFRISLFGMMPDLKI